MEYCTSLTELSLGINEIDDIVPLSSLTGLTVLKLFSNRISDISSLVNNSGFVDGDVIWITFNSLDLSEDSETLNNIKQLEERGVIIHY
ncbi:leucine-rich repeat domain-containing protein [Chloroflexota bacterium]